MNDKEAIGTEVGSRARRDHRNLVAWQKAFELTIEVYRATATFPREEMFGLTAQLRRAAVSVTSNIAEGAGRRTTRDFMSFLHVARGSLAELETQILLAIRIGLLESESPWISRTSEVGRLLNALIRALGEKIQPGTDRR